MSSVAPEMYPSPATSVFVLCCCPNFENLLRFLLCFSCDSLTLVKVKVLRLFNFIVPPWHMCRILMMWSMVFDFILTYYDVSSILLAFIIFMLLLSVSSWSWSYCSWIYNYLCNQWLSPLTFGVLIPFMARCTRYNMMWLSFYWLVTGLLFSLGTRVPSTAMI